MVEGTGLENRQALTGLVSSNLTPSALTQTLRPLAFVVRDFEKFRPRKGPKGWRNLPPFMT